jgi:hypothetical protein
MIFQVIFERSLMAGFKRFRLMPDLPVPIAMAGKVPAAAHIATTRPFRRDIAT